MLGIETSCDETAAAVVKDGRHILSSVVASSLPFHRKYGGIVPEIAFRKQLESMVQVAECSLSESGLGLEDIGLVSVTSGPGLLGSLLVGVSFAKSLSLARRLPLVGVNHLYSHIYASFLEGVRIKPPFVALVISGGHTSLFHLEDFTKIRLLGATLDDACGEAFDKVAKILGLGYPGGPAIEKAGRLGDPAALRLSCCQTTRPLDFSFSGIKTAVLYHVRRRIGVSSKNRHLSLFEVRDIASSFQQAVVEAVVTKALLACRLTKSAALVVGGGVAANARLREELFLRAAASGIHAYFPSKGLCLDNAAMVAGLGYQLFRKGRLAGLGLNVMLE